MIEQWINSLQPETVLPPATLVANAISQNEVSLTWADLSENEADVLDAVMTKVPDVLISDIGMPGVDGYDLIRQVRGLPRDRGGKIPAIALTAYTRTEDRLQSLRAGYDMHVERAL